MFCQPKTWLGYAGKRHQLCLRWNPSTHEGIKISPSLYQQILGGNRTDKVSIIKGDSLEWPTQEGLRSPMTAAWMLERLKSLELKEAGGLHQEPQARIMECCWREALSLSSSFLGKSSQTHPEARPTLSVTSGLPHSNTKDKMVLWAAAGRGLEHGSVSEQSTGTHRALGCNQKKDTGCAQAAALSTEGTEPTYSYYDVAQP